jgi:hypothetical protein
MARVIPVKKKKKSETKFPKKCQTTICKEPAGVLQSFVPLRQSALIRFLQHSNIHSTSHYSEGVISHLESHCPSFVFKVILQTVSFGRLDRSQLSSETYECLLSWVW